MPISLSQFNSGDVITAESVMDRLDAMEKYINGGISSADLSTSPWVKTEHIVKPEFYGSPSPRFLGVTSDVHHRHIRNNIQEFDLFIEEMGTEWHVIPSLAASFYCDQDAVIEVYTSFWVYETGGSVSSFIGDENTRAARIKLFLDGTGEDTTQRRVSAGSSDSDVAHYHRRFHHILWRSTTKITKGPHSVSVRIQPANLGSASSRTYSKIFVGTRSFNVNLRYL